MALFARLARIGRHRWTDEADVRRALPADLLDRLTRRVAASERRHTGEIRLCVEAGLPLSYLWRDAPARERAIMLFGKLRVWDTEHNNGVLIYLLLADRDVEIVADRGFNGKVTAQEWEQVCRRMEASLREGHHADAVIAGIENLSRIVARHFPPAAGARNELPDEPVTV